MYRLAVCLCLIAAPAVAGDIALSTRPDAVTVFPDRALMSRGGAVTLPAGSHTIVVDGLPSSLLAPSLRVGGKGVAGLVIGSVESRVVPAELLVHEQERVLQDRLTGLGDQRRMIEASLKALELRRKFIETLATTAPAGQEDQPGLPPEQWETAWGRLQAGGEQTYKDMVAQEIALRDIDTQIAKVRAELGSVRTGAKAHTQLRIQVEAPRDGAAELTVQYQVPNASWSPVYDARLDTAAGTLTLTQYGTVRQRTGEDWDGVALTLSTAQPNRGSRMPELAPWWIEPMPPPAPLATRTRSMMPQAGADRAMPAPMAKAAPEAEEPVEMRAAEVVATDFAAEYRIAGRLSVPADSADHRFAIAETALPAALSARVVPKLEPRAYLFAEVKVAGEAPTLPGPVSLFRDGTYIGNGRLDMLRPGDTAELSYGVDDQVTVEYLPQRGQSGEQGFLSKERRVERRFKTHVANLHTRPLTVKLYDQLPVSRIDEVKVALIDKDTTPGFQGDIKDRPGVLAWSWEAKAGEKRTIDFGYAVTFPPDRAPPGF